MTWAQVKLNTSEITVKGENTKSFQTRIIPLNKHTVSVLRNWKLQQVHSKDELVFPGKSGKLTSLRKSFYPLLEDAQIKRVEGDVSLNWHSLRHTFGTRLGQAGVDPATIKKLMGHADLKTTQRYLHTDEDRMRAAIEKMV